MPKSLTGELESYYVGSAGRAYRRRHFAVANEEIFSAIARQRARKIQPYIAADDRVFEYGVGVGYNLAKLRCKEKVGYDLFNNAADLAALGIDFYADTASLDHASFGVVICLHTLEHVVNPWESLMEMRRVLQRGGRFIVCVPYEQGRASRRFDADNLHQHVYSWNVQTLGMLLTKAGFMLDTIGVRRFGYDRFTATLPGAAKSDLIYRVANWSLLRLRPHYEVMAVCRKIE